MKYLEYIGLLLVGLLFFVWPIPHTITLRGILILSSLVVFGSLALKNSLWRQRLRELGVPFIILNLFVLWGILQAVFISDETSWALREVIGQWGNGLAALCIGVAVGISTERSDTLKKNILQILLWVLVAHILYIDLDQIIVLIKSGQWQARGAARGLTEGIDKSNYLSSYLLLILGTDIFFRIVYKRRVILINNLALLALMLITFLSIYLEAMRNGTITAALVLVILLVLLLKETKSSIAKPITILMVFAVIFSFLFISQTLDQRWKNFSQTIPLALDTQHNKAWLDYDKYPLPKLGNGKSVEVSAYLRIAWLKEGILLAIEHPLGIGLGRNALGHGLLKKYNEGSGHSHSGILDIAIGAGIPGCVLWAGFLVSLIGSSFKHAKLHKSYSALLLFLISVNFMLRMTVDSIIRDHILQQFMFFVGLLYIFMLRERDEPRPVSVTRPTP